MATPSEQTITSHSIHPHPLTFSNLSQQNPNPTCSACPLSVTGAAYSCSSCNFFLHRECYNQDYLQIVPIHQSYSLSPQVTPAYPEGLCNSCGNFVDGLYCHCNPSGIEGTTDGGRTPPDLVEGPPESERDGGIWDQFRDQLKITGKKALRVGIVAAAQSVLDKMSGDRNGVIHAPCGDEMMGSGLYSGGRYEDYGRPRNMRMDTGSYFGGSYEDYRHRGVRTGAKSYSGETYEDYDRRRGAIMDAGSYSVETYEDYGNRRGMRTDYEDYGSRRGMMMGYEDYGRRHGGVRMEYDDYDVRRSVRMDVGSCPAGGSYEYYRGGGARTGAGSYSGGTHEDYRRGGQRHYY